MEILVHIETDNGSVKKFSLEALSYAKELSSKINKNVTAAVFANKNDIISDQLAKIGADNIIYMGESDNAMSKANSIVNLDPEILLLSYTLEGTTVAPFVAAKLNASFVSGVISNPDLSNGFVVKKEVFSGKGIAHVNLIKDKKVLALSPNSLEINENPVQANITESSISEVNSGIEVLSENKTSGKVSLTDAEIVVSGGRGLKGPENFSMTEELAATLGAATACSKPVSDMDWRPHSEHVGQTGITIKPNLYIAVGISGAIQHLAGVSGSKYIVVINTDKDAPFFKAADYGVIGDAFEVVPKLIAALKA